jgi:FkbM family methyltransferase
MHYADYGSLRHLYDEIFVNRLYEVSLDTDAPIIVDCGSNIGMAAFYFKRRFPKATVMCFEPHPVLFETLRKNALPLKVEVHQVALGRTEGSIELFVNDGDNNTRSLNFSVHDRGARTSVTVRCARLSQVMPERVDLLKLDIEGSEDAVIQELAESGALGRIKNIVCEYHHHIAGPPSHLSGMLAILESAGFVYSLGAYANVPPVPAAYQDILIYATRLAQPTKD